MKVSQIIFNFIVFLLVLLITYKIHIDYFPIRVLFYAAIFDALVASIVTFIFLYFFNFLNHSTVGEKILIGILFILSGYSIAISIPTVIDRSLSFYILEKLQQRDGGIQKSAFDRVFREEYMYEHRLMDVRLTEQLESRTIMIVNGCVMLTEKGKRIASFSRFFRAHFLPQKRVLFGKETSDLVDPFKSSPVIVDYTCKEK